MFRFFINNKFFEQIKAQNGVKMAITIKSIIDPMPSPRVDEAGGAPLANRYVESMQQKIKKY